MNKHSFKIFHAGLAAIFVLAGLSSCSDTWDSHYKTDSSIRSDNSLWESLQAQDTLRDFRSILEATHVSSYGKSSDVTFAELLNAEQNFTIWAPTNGSFNKDSLLNLCQTEAGQLTVEKTFVRNHIARYLFSINSSTDKSILMLNGKAKTLKGLVFEKIAISTPNILTNNGVLHILNGDINYIGNLYEGLCSGVEYSKFGSYLKSFQKDSLNEFASVASGIVDGKTVYVDSVMIEKNLLLSEIGYLNKEDSSYMVITPTDNAWTAAYNKIFPYYYFGNIAHADSIQDYWTKHAIATDLVFNANAQASKTDSMISTRFNPLTPSLHVFHKPYQAGGIFSEISGVSRCSNGNIYKVDKWPFTLQEIFFQPIKMEAELGNNVISNAFSTINLREVLKKGVSGNAYMDLAPATSASNPQITFNVKNTLSGKYDVCIVLLPKTVYKTPVTHDDSLDVFRPYKFRATIGYRDESGQSKSFSCLNDGAETFSNDPYKNDTVCVASGFKFPICTLNSNETIVTLKLQSLIKSAETSTYNREMFIDCVYLKPRED